MVCFSYKRKQAYVRNQPSIIEPVCERVLDAFEQCFDLRYIAMRTTEGPDSFDCACSFDLLDGGPASATELSVEAAHWRLRHTPGWWRISWRTLGLEIYALTRAVKPRCMLGYATKAPAFVQDLCENFTCEYFNLKCTY